MENKLKVFEIKDEMTPVLTFVHFRSGTYIAIKTTARNARITIAEWKKAMLHFNLLLEDQMKNIETIKSAGEREPYFLYYFMEGSDELSETQKPVACFIMPNVVAIHFDVIQPDPHERMIHNQEEMTNLIRQILKEEQGGEDWKKRTE